MYKNCYGVSEVFGTILLLSITITLFSTVSLFVFSFTATSPAPVVDIIGTIEENILILEHRGGMALSLNSSIIVTINGSTEKLTVFDYLSNMDKSDGKWNIGERLLYRPTEDIRLFQADTIVVDADTGAVVMRGTVKGTPIADLNLSFMVDNPSPSIGETVTYTIYVTNEGHYDAYDVIINIKLPEGLTFESSSGNTSYDPTTRTLFWGMYYNEN